MALEMLETLEMNNGGEGETSHPAPPPVAPSAGVGRNAAGVSWSKLE